MLVDMVGISPWIAGVRGYARFANSAISNNRVILSVQFQLWGAAAVPEISME